MIAGVQSFVLQGIDAVSCEIEADLSPVGLPKTTVVGLPDTAVKESMERVRAALLNSGYRFPQSRITINLAPADIPKEGPVYDLPLAIAILVADGTIDPQTPGGESKNDGVDEEMPASGTSGGLHDYLIAGELALDGRVRPIKGVISQAILAKELMDGGEGIVGVIVPKANAQEAAAIDGIEILGVSSLEEVVAHFNGGANIEPQRILDVEQLVEQRNPEIDFADIRGQEAAKRAMLIAASGGHNIIMLGPPGSGKTMLARALPGILPRLTRDEVLEVSRIYSSVGQLEQNEPLVLKRPVRSPHHTASSPAIIGGGTIPRPGDVSLAHRGILFLDEIPEFSRHVLETLRQPLEEGHVTIARAKGSIKFPARFMFVGALNPTPKGQMATDEYSQRAMDKYLAKLSGPLIDRIDIHIEVPAVPYKKLTSKEKGTGTATLRDQVSAVRQIQKKRQKGIPTAELSGKQLDKIVLLDEPSQTMLGQAMTELKLSARAYDKIRRIARTIADLDAEETVKIHHIAEAVQYRILDRGQ